MATIHTFDTTGEAYDACQCDDTIRNGDILVCTHERVIGIADTWPIAVTVERGHLHRNACNAAGQNWRNEHPLWFYEAEKLAVEYGWL